MELFDILIGDEPVPLADRDFGDYERYVSRVLFLAYVNSKRGNNAWCLESDFLEWYATHSGQFGLRLPQFEAVIEKSQAEGREMPYLTVEVPHRTIAGHRTNAPPVSPLQRRVDWVAQTLELDARSALILGIVYRLTRVQAFAPLGKLFNDSCRRGELSSEVLASLVGLNERGIEDYLGRRSPLLRLGLLEDRHGGDIGVSALLTDLLRRDTVDPAVLEQSLLGNARVPLLGRADFDHLGEAVEDVRRIIEGAFTRRERGVNILFHGHPGTGKTEFATLLAALCDAHVVFAGETDRNDKEPDRSDRLTHLSFLSAIGQRVGRTVVVVDEADDVFVGTDSGSGSDRQGAKVFLNRLVERSPVPTIWITNHTGFLGEAVLRRMVRAVEFRKPGIVVRRRIVERHSASLNVSLDDASRERLAHLPVAPAIIASALRAASLCGEDTEAGTGRMAVASATSIHQAMSRREVSAALPQAVRFDASLSSADVDLVSLEERVVAAGAGALSFLFTGLPGTGKSAFARHLAGRLGMEVLEKRGSDLLGMYVGQTEANIAEAFREALDGNMFLVFDEADSLLADRSGAFRNWEVSQVNEMLTWMERHPLPFAATSNLLDRLDPAVQRRFLFKARFSAMTGPQIAKAFRSHFGRDAPQAVLKLDLLTPGDFVVVARKARVLKVADAPALGEMLKAEVALKPGAREPIGFI